MKFDTTPDPQFLLAMQNQSWTVGGALSELVDNSFGPGRGNADMVTITHNTRKRTITVVDDGQGMEAIGRLFQLGNTIGRTPGDIGKYGSGGTMAILWLASRVTVWTMRNGKVSYDTVDWPTQIRKRQFPQVSNDWVPANVNNTPAELLAFGQGTVIHLQLAKERSFYASNVQRDLAATYAPASRHGKELVWTTIGRNGGTQILGVPLHANGQDLSVRGKVGLVKDLPHSRSRVAISYGPRVILKTRDCYESLDGEERYVGTGIAGWLDLGEGWQEYLSTTKDRMNDEPLWHALMGHVFKQIRPLLKQVEQDELYLELEELAIDLQQAFDGKFDVSVEDRPKKKMPEDIEFGPAKGDTQEPSDETEDEGDDEIEAKKPARTRIAIWPTSDQDLDGLLCRAELRGGDTIAVLVNKDHEVVAEALKAKPVNRMALNMLTTREIASEIVKEDEVLERLFARHVLETIEQKRENGGGEEQYVARLLIDRVRRVAA
jgi:hypothetical protein